MAHGEWITIEERFCGPPRSGNGGYVCGRVAAGLVGAAAGLGADVVVRLKAPPPIGRPLGLETTESGARLVDGETVIAEAKRGALELAVPPAPSFDEAERASTRYLGFDEHNFPTCFVCGPARAPGDGLRIFPGALAAAPAKAGEGVAAESCAQLAATWTPDASLADDAGRVRPEFLWAALDCPGAFTRYPLPAGVALVLGELAVSIGDRPRAGESCVLTAWSLGDEGRRRQAGTALFDRDGRLLAKARAVWVEVPAQVWS
ncbi:MAG: hypothetical protein IPK00_25650 [Deltaproteobacteria bacterium]|nr:hypothetical protein [Deltaproteobacteria bacterium]